MNKLSILELKAIIAHKPFLFGFKAFNNSLPLMLNSTFNLKCSPCYMRFTNNFIIIITF